MKFWSKIIHDSQINQITTHTPSIYNLKFHNSQNRVGLHEWDSTYMIITVSSEKGTMHINMKYSVSLEIVLICTIITNAISKRLWPNCVLDQSRWEIANLQAD